MNPYVRIPKVTFDSTVLEPARNRWQVIRRGKRNCLEIHLKCRKVKYFGMTEKN
jgi:hypothetical protein